MFFGAPETKPAIHSGWGILVFSIWGLVTGTVSGKIVFNESDKPKFIDARILTISCNPLADKCSPSVTLSIICLNKMKSALSY